MKKEQINLKEYAIRIAKTDKEIADIKQLDDTAFKGRHGVTLEELHKVKELGFIFILYNVTTGAIVGEAQLLLRPISEIPYGFEYPVGYCYRIGIYPDFQGCGFGKILIAKVWETAIENGVKELRLSVRAENYPSLKLMFSQGFQIIEYKKNFYGPDKIKGSRLIMSRKKEQDPPPPKACLPAGRASARQSPPSLQTCLPDRQASARQGKQDYIKTKFLPVAFNKPFSKESYKQIESLMSQGFCGVGVNKLGIEFAR